MVLLADLMRQFGVKQLNFIQGKGRAFTEIAGVRIFISSKTPIGEINPMKSMVWKSENGNYIVGNYETLKVAGTIVLED